MLTGNEIRVMKVFHEHIYRVVLP